MAATSRNKKEWSVNRRRLAGEGSQSIIGINIGSVNIGGGEGMAAAAKIISLSPLHAWLSSLTNRTYAALRPATAWGAANACEMKRVNMNAPSSLTPPFAAACLQSVVERIGSRCRPGEARTQAGDCRGVGTSSLPSDM